MTVTGTVPVPDGATAEMTVPDTTRKLEAGFGPNLTAVAPVNPCPDNRTADPPLGSPPLGKTGDIVGQEIHCDTDASPWIGARGGHVGHVGARPRWRFDEREWPGTSPRPHRYGGLAGRTGQ